MSTLRGSGTEQKKIRKSFKNIFKLAPEGDKGNKFDYSFVNSKATTKEGLNEIRGLYDSFVIQNNINPDKDLNDILGFKNEKQSNFVNTLAELYKDFDNKEKQRLFILQGLGLNPVVADVVTKDVPPDAPTEAPTEPAPPKVAVSKVTKVTTPREMESEPKPKTIAQMKEEEEEEKEEMKSKGEDIKKIAEQLSKEAIERGKKEAIKKMEAPTMSPDERDIKEEMAQEKKAQEEAKRERPTTGMTEKQEIELLGISEPDKQIDMKISKQTPKRSPDEIDTLEPLPSKSDFIPPMRLGTRGKDIKELLNDIAYFFKNFKSQLNREAEFFKNIDKTNIDQVRELHNRIVGKLAPKKKEEANKKVGIIVNADEYIREQMKKILQEQTFASLRPQDVIIDVGNREAEGRERDTKDFGDFAVKRTIDGGLASQREAVFRYMPSENDPDVGEEGLSKEKKRKPKRLNLPPPRLNNERTTALKRNLNNPFRIPQRRNRLTYLY